MKLMSTVFDVDSITPSIYKPQYVGKSFGNYGNFTIKNIEDNGTMTVDVGGTCPCTVYQDNIDELFDIGISRIVFESTNSVCFSVFSVSDFRNITFECKKSLQFMPGRTHTYRNLRVSSNESVYFYDNNIDKYGDVLRFNNVKFDTDELNLGDPKEVIFDEDCEFETSIDIIHQFNGRVSESLQMKKFEMAYLIPNRPIEEMLDIPTGFHSYCLTDTERSIRHYVINEQITNDCKNLKNGYWYWKQHS